jgi:hypothetical protein
MRGMLCGPPSRFSVLFVLCPCKYVFLHVAENYYLYIYKKHILYICLIYISIYQKIEKINYLN